MYKYTKRSEEDVGITERIGPLTNPRFSAIVKERFSDFHVNEIDPTGQILRLTSLEPPVDNRVQVALNNPEIAALVPEGSIEQVCNLQKRLIENEQLEKHKKDKQLMKESVEIKVTQLDKESRTKIHRWISSFDTLSSETLEKEGGEKFIKVVAMSTNPRLNRRPANRAKFTHCVMFKEGVETSEAIGFIAKKLNVKPGLISYAGIKDKRAKTTQRISVSNVEASRLIGICKYSKGIKLGNFEYNPRPISLGELKGNHFKLLLKNLTLQDPTPIEQVVEKSVDSLKTLGFINYYGMQRFGSYEVSTWEVGKHIFNQNWMQAFDLLLKPKPNDHPLVVKAKELWLKERNAEEAIKLLSRHRSIESHLLHSLSKSYHKNDFVTVFLKLPRHQRLLYVHAYQSYLWNQVASFRIKEYGLQVVEGDLVFEDPACDIVDNSGIDLDELDGQTVTEDESPSLQGPQKPKVKLLTEKDIEDGQYSIYDVLIPLFGSDVIHPGNKTGQFSEKLLKDEGVDKECLLKFRPIGDKPTGGYRKVVVLPKNVSHEVRSYSSTDVLDTFIPSDWDILQQQQSTAEPDSKLDQTMDKESSAANEKKDKKCLILEFSLPSSSYATMALRELIYQEQITPPVTKDSKSNDNEDRPVSKKSRQDDNTVDSRPEINND